MPVADIDRWEFFVPHGWGLKDSGIGISYLESPDGTKGMYVKSITMGNARQSNHALAEYIQDIHRRSFEEDPQADWAAISSRGQPDGQLYRSVLDLYDVDATYRVLSLVVCDDRYAVQITIHDYNCKDYAGAIDDFLGIENSIRQFAGAA